MFPITAETPQFEPITGFNDTWESCPVWVQ
jgi:hypothetical protein